MPLKPNDSLQLFYISQSFIGHRLVVFFCQIIVYTLNSLMKHLDTNLDTSEKSLDTFWILLGALSDTWPPLHVATEVPSREWSSRCYGMTNEL